MFTNCFVVVSLAPNIIHSEIKYRALLGNAAITGKRQWGAPLQSQDFNIFFFLFFSPFSSAVSRWHVARVALLPECRRRRCIFRGQANSSLFAPRAVGWLAGWLAAVSAGVTRAHASHRSVWKSRWIVAARQWWRWMTYL